jgi:hypothetical protein
MQIAEALSAAAVIQLTILMVLYAVFRHLFKIWKVTNLLIFQKFSKNKKIVRNEVEP